MAEKTILSLLRETFPAATKEDWKRTAGQEIDGQDPLETLAWKSSGDAAFLPYYDQDDSKAREYLTRFQLSPSHQAYSGPGGWASLPTVAVTNAATANTAALKHLNQGADGVLFDLREGTHAFEELLASIEWPYCTLSFRISSSDAAAKLYEYISKKQYDVATLNGSLFWDKMPESNITGLDAQKNIQGMGLWILPSTPAEEISAALLHGVHAVDHLLKRNNLPVNDAIHQVAFSLAAGNNFLLTIAKLKALRLLWFQVAQAYGVRAYTPNMLSVHARSEVWTEEKFQPHANLLSSTTAAFASVLGGCNTLTVFVEDANNSMMNRVARNVSNILREESHVDKVADPLDGSYALEAMVDALAQEAWQKFQSALQSF